MGDFFHRLADEIANDREHRGCFLVNTALEMSPHNERIRQLVNEQLGAIESLLLNALRSAQDGGELSARHDPALLAKHLMVNIWGLRVLGQTNAAADTVQANVDILLSSLSGD